MTSEALVRYEAASHALRGFLHEFYYQTLVAAGKAT